ncbi:MFS transporter [Spirochaetes bacterium]|uniref:MFS transporter n=1 Tax=Candidatus Scatousia excrementipullorum TaxID=2840936 RepID=A0A9D9DQ43_9BACT|nr:MFS transporter [Candidatus Scatousia excrementipullorum]
MEENNNLKRFTTAQFLNFCLGFFGLQFAWQMRIILSGPVTEGLGASPFIYGLIWLAGPFTGMVVQPLIGALSDKTVSPFGRRRPYLLGGALLASIALWIFPNSEYVANAIHNVTGLHLPACTALLIAAVMIWIIDACVNVAQGPYRALIPDVVVPEQHSIANSYISLAIGLGSVVAAGTAPFLKWAFNYQMSIPAQFIMAALAFTLGMLWTCITIKEHQTKKDMIKDVATAEIKEDTFIDALKNFFALSPEVSKICIMQFFTWIGTMCMMIFFTQYSVHTIYSVPDLSSVSDEISNYYANATLIGTNFSSICFAIFNLICFLVAIPIGVLSAKYGNKRVHIISLITMILAYLGMAFSSSPKVVAFMMGVAGIGWASICALPFAMLSQYIKKGTEGSVMGIFNIFIAGPQVFVCTLVAWFISKCIIKLDDGLINYHWEYVFIVGAICLAVAALITHSVKEKRE